MNNEAKNYWDCLSFSQKLDIVADVATDYYFGQMHISDRDKLVCGVRDMLDDDVVFDTMVERFEDEIETVCEEKYREEEREIEMNRTIYRR